MTTKHEKKYRSAAASAVRNTSVAIAFHGFCLATAVAISVTVAELHFFGADDAFSTPNFKAMVAYATLTLAIYLGSAIGQLVGYRDAQLAYLRSLLLNIFCGIAVFVGTYTLGWDTHAAIAAIFASLITCISQSAKLANTTLFVYAALGFAGFSMNPDLPSLTDSQAFPLSAFWSVFTALLLPFTVVAIMNVIVERIFSTHETSLSAATEAAGRAQTLAETDPLTGFFNRNKLEEAFSAHIANISGSRSLLVALLDLDNFKAVNTSAGHSAGDTVLQHSAERIRSALPGASLIRLGGDEFLALSAIDDESEDVMTVLSHVTEPFATEYQGERIWHSISVGYTLVSDTAASVSQVIAEADLAMRQAKRDGKGRAVGYAPGESVPAAVSAPVTHATFNPSLTGSDIKQEIPPRSVGAAILSGEIDFEFQPIVDVSRGDIVAAEALLRWRLSDGSLVPMQHYLGTFVALEWQSPFIDFLSRKRLQLIKDIRAASPIAVHFNFALESIQAFRQSDDVARLVDVADGRNEGLVVELSEKRFEHVTTDDAPQGITPAESFPHRDKAADMGVKLALDDFGTGQSNLDRLVSYPVQIVKLDRSVCLRVAKSKRAHSVIRHTREICDELNIALIAEGIETQEQSDALMDLGVTLHQGFFHFEPMPKDELLEVLHRRAA